MYGFDPTRHPVITQVSDGFLLQIPDPTTAKVTYVEESIHSTRRAAERRIFEWLLGARVMDGNTESRLSRSRSISG